MRRPHSPTQYSYDPGKINAEILQAEAPAEWPRIVGMRNMLAHQYAELDQQILQNTIDNRLDGLIQLVNRLRIVVTASEDTDDAKSSAPAD